MQASLVVVAMCALVGVARGEKLAAVATVNVDPNMTELRVVGDDRVALTAFTCEGDDCHVDVVNTATQTVERVHTSRTRIDRKLTHGRRFDAALVSDDGRRAGFVISDRDGSEGYHWFAEIDVDSGAIKRSTRIARADATTELYPLAGDPTHHAVWFYVLGFDGPRVHYARERSARSLTLRRISLDDLATDDIATLALPARLQAPSQDHDLTVEMSADFSHAVVIEYYEEPHRLSPPASAYVIDTATGSAFRVAIPQVVYGAAFSSDHLYLASAVTGEIDRIDLATGEQDLVAHGPKLAHHLAITGDRIAVLGSSRTITSLDLPTLDHPREVAHDAALALLGSQLVVTPNGLIVAPRPKRGYVIARIQ